MAMHRTNYVLRPRSHTWQAGRLLGFDMTVEHDGRQIGGHNVQVVLGAPDQVRRGLDDDVALELDTGWWVTLRNQFALASCVAVEILDSARHALNDVTAEANAAYGEASEGLWARLRSSGFSATGPTTGRRSAAGYIEKRQPKPVLIVSISA
ncbi:MAG: hypothetical protein JO372_21815 [Solirubrobacterales bacterium]|nr:hypothetical protein [Solirubrobacterales bacterium]